MHFLVSVLISYREWNVYHAAIGLQLNDPPPKVELRCMCRPKVYPKYSWRCTPCCDLELMSELRFIVIPQCELE